MKWISVKDQLPEETNNSCADDSVLIYSDINGPRRYGIGSHSIEGGWDILGEQGAHSCTGFYVLESDDITHWMPLPLPPKPE